MAQTPIGMKKSPKTSDQVFQQLDPWWIVIILVLFALVYLDGQFGWVEYLLGHN